MSNRSKLNKSDLVKTLEVVEGLSQESAELVVDTILNSMRSTLRAQGKVVLPNIGTLEGQVKPIKDTVLVKARRKFKLKVRFTQSRNLGDSTDDKGGESNPFEDLNE